MSFDRYGFNKETLEGIVIRLTSQIKEVIPTINLDPSNLMYQWIKVVSLEIYYLQTLIEDQIANMTPLGASGSFLDYHALINGLERKGAEYAVGTLQLTNNTELVDQLITTGSTFSTVNGNEYVTLEDIIFYNRIVINHTTGGAGSSDVIPARYDTVTPDSTLQEQNASDTGNDSADPDIVVKNTIDPDTPQTGTIYIDGTPYAYASWTDLTFTLDGVTLGASYSEDDEIYYPTVNGTYHSGAIKDLNLNDITGIYEISSGYLNWKTGQDPVLNDYQQYYLLLKTPLIINVSVSAAIIGLDGNTGVDTITVNTYSLLGIDIVGNSVALTNGQNEESDNDLRVRILSVRNRHFTTHTIKSMINQLTGVRDSKVAQILGLDYSLLDPWTITEPVTENTHYVKILEDKIYQLAYYPRTVGVQTLKGITVHLKDEGDAPTLYLYLGNKSEGSFHTLEENPIASNSITRGIMVTGGSGAWQDVTFPIKYNGVEQASRYGLYIYSAGDASNHWQIAISPASGTVDTGMQSSWETEHILWDRTEFISDTGNNLGDGDVVVTATHGITGVGWLTIAGDKYEFASAATDTFTLASGVTLLQNYTSGDEVFIYQEDTAGIGGATTNVIPYQSKYGSHSISVSIIPELAYDFETDLYEDIDNLLNWENDSDDEGGYVPIGTDYSITEAQKLYLRIPTADISISDNYELDEVVSRIQTNITDHLNDLAPGDDIIYSQVEKVILTTEGVWRLRNMTINIVDDEGGSPTIDIDSTDDNEVDIGITDIQYVVIGSVFVFTEV